MLGKIQGGERKIAQGDTGWIKRIFPAEIKGSEREFVQGGRVQGEERLSGELWDGERDIASRSTIHFKLERGFLGS